MTKPRQAAEHERMEYKTLDGNWTTNVQAYCSYHKRYITEKQARLHRCNAKHGGICGRYQNMKGVYVRKMKQEQFYDKAIDRLNKMCGTLEKMTRAIDNISGFVDILTDIHREESISKAEQCKYNMVDDGK